MVFSSTVIDESISARGTLTVKQREKRSESLRPYTYACTYFTSVNIMREMCRFAACEQSVKTHKDQFIKRNTLKCI